MTEGKWNLGWDGNVLCDEKHMQMTMKAIKTKESMCFLDVELNVLQFKSNAF